MATPAPKLSRLLARGGPRHKLWKLMSMACFALALQGNNCVTIAAAPAASMAHLKMMATQRFGSNQLTALRKIAPTKQIAEICRRAWAVDISKAYRTTCVPPGSLARPGACFAGRRSCSVT